MFAPQDPPSCCQTCPHFASRRCELLWNPTAENRRALFRGKPCRPDQILQRTLRGYRSRSPAEDLAQAALARFLELDWSPERFRQTYGARPIDARLWATTWPWMNLVPHGTNDREVSLDDAGVAEDTGAGIGEGNVDAEQLTEALVLLRRISPESAALVLDCFHGTLDTKRWKELIGCGDAELSKRKALAQYCFFALYYEILPRVRALVQQAARPLEAWRFTPGVRRFEQAYTLTAGELGNPDRAAWRQLYGRGAESSLDVLAESDALGRRWMNAMETAFRVALDLKKREGSSLSEAQVVSA